MEKELTEEKVNAVDIKHFISLIRKCKEPTEISDLMFAELIDKIVVYEAEGVGKARTQKVDIYFNYVGQVDIAYTYAKQFYEEAYHFIEEKFGAENVISAVMHADEINIAATEELGKEVYHYHLHAMVLPVVEKEILWSKRCKDEKLRGTVKEVVHQISHSKKWKSDIPLTDEKGNPLLRKNGKPMFRASYSILQDELFNHMTEQGFKGFQRGEYGSTAEHLTSLQYQIKQDKERLEKLQKRIQHEQIKYEPARNVSKTYNEIDRMGQKTITGKMAISKEDYSELTALAKEGITSRAEISELEQSANYEN